MQQGASKAGRRFSIVDNQQLSLDQLSKQEEQDGLKARNGLLQCTPCSPGNEGLVGGRLDVEGSEEEHLSGMSYLHRLTEQKSTRPEATDHAIRRGTTSKTHTQR